MLDSLEHHWTPPERLPQQVIHGDIRLGNVATTPDGAVAYFDFGFAARRPRIHDLAYSLFWIVLKPDASGRAEEFDWRLASQLVAAYETTGVHPLTDLERRAIGPYVAGVPMYFAAIASYIPTPAAASNRRSAPSRSLVGFSNTKTRSASKATNLNRTLHERDEPGKEVGCHG